MQGVGCLSTMLGIRQKYENIGTFGWLLDFE